MSCHGRCRPDKLLESFAESSHPKLSFGITFAGRHQHADASQPLSLLRVRRERPRGHCAAECDQPRGVVSLHLRTLAREGRMTVTIGRRELLCSLHVVRRGWLLPLPPLALGECHHRGLALRSIAVRIRSSSVAASRDRVMGWGTMLCAPFLDFASVNSLIRPMMRLTAWP
jgi:hypothetical protein